MYYHFRDDPSRVMVVVNFEPTMSDITDNKDNSFDKKGIMKKKMISKSSPLRLNLGSSDWVTEISKQSFFRYSIAHFSFP